MEFPPDPQPLASSPGTANVDQTRPIQESAVAKLEKLERHGPMESLDNSSSKRIKPDPTIQPESERFNPPESADQVPSKNDRRKGVAPIKAESVLSILHYDQ